MHGGGPTAQPSFHHAAEGCAFPGHHHRPSVPPTNQWHGAPTHTNTCPSLLTPTESFASTAQQDGEPTCPIFTHSKGEDTMDVPPAACCPSPVPLEGCVLWSSCTGGSFQGRGCGEPHGVQQNQLNSSSSVPPAPQLTPFPIQGSAAPASKPLISPTTRCNDLSWGSLQSSFHELRARSRAKGLLAGLLPPSHATSCPDLKCHPKKPIHFAAPALFCSSRCHFQHAGPANVQQKSRCPHQRTPCATAPHLQLQPHNGVRVGWAQRAPSRAQHCSPVKA